MGRKPVLVLSLVGTALGSLITGLAGAVWVLFLGRVVDGVSGASVSVAQAAVADVAPEEDRARLLGLLGAAFGLGFVIGPAIGALAALGGPKVPFFVAAAIAGLNAAAAVRRLPETNPRHAGGDRPRVEPLSAGAGGVGLLLGVTFAALVAFSAFEATFSLFVFARFGFTLASTGASFAAIGLVIVAVQVRLVGPVVERFGERGAVRLGLLCNAAGLVAMASAHSLLVLAPAVLALVIGQGIAGPTLSSLVAGRVGRRRRGGVLGLQQAAGGMARVVGPVTGGFLFQHVGTPAPYVGGAVLTALAALCYSSVTTAEEAHRG